ERRRKLPVANAKVESVGSSRVASADYSISFSTAHSRKRFTVKYPFEDKRPLPKGGALCSERSWRVLFGQLLARSSVYSPGSVMVTGLFVLNSALSSYLP